MLPPPAAACRLTQACPPTPSPSLRPSLTRNVLHGRDAGRAGGQGSRPAGGARLPDAQARCGAQGRCCVHAAACCRRWCRLGTRRHPWAVLHSECVCYPLARGVARLATAPAPHCTSRMRDGREEACGRQMMVALHARLGRHGALPAPPITLYAAMPVLLDLPAGLEAARELLAAEPADLRAKAEACNAAELEAIIAQYKAALTQVLDAGRALGEAARFPNCGAGARQTCPSFVHAQGGDQTPLRCTPGSPRSPVARCRRRRRCRLQVVSHTCIPSLSAPVPPRSHRRGPGR